MSDPGSWWHVATAPDRILEKSRKRYMKHALLFAATILIGVSTSMAMQQGKGAGGFGGPYRAFKPWDCAWAGPSCGNMNADCIQRAQSYGVPAFCVTGPSSNPAYNDWNGDNCGCWTI